MKAIILAAGVGSRLGMPYPKTLSQLPDGERILGRQIRLLRANGINEIIVVVGFKKEFIMEHFPDVLYKYNPLFYITNTAKSLLAGVEDLNDDVLWLNGDVIFDEQVISDVIKVNGNVIAVNTAKCGDEEVKYSTDQKGYIKAIGKELQSAQGEAVGINKICRKDLNSLKEALRRCSDSDYFEKGIEILIAQGKRFKPVDISDYRCIEVDFLSDWEVAVSLFQE